MAVTKVDLKSVLVMAFSTFLLGCQPPQETAVVAFKVPVTTAKVTVTTIEDVIKATGTLKVAKLVTLPVKTDGTLKIAVGANGPLVEGDHVKAGDLIASIIGEGARLAANMRVAKKRLEVAKENLAATTELFRDKLVSVERHGQDKTAYEEAVYQYERALHTENRNKIVTPIDGVIIEMARANGQWMADGQLVVPGQVIATIAPMSPLVADVDLVGKDVVKITQGMIARARYHGLDNQQFDGKLLRMAPTINQKTRTLRAEVEIENKQELLKPGMFVEVTLVVQRKENVVVVPRRALTQRGGRRVVFVVKGQRAMQREVELGLGDDQFVEVIKGVEAGDDVVVLGLQTLSDQMPVKVTGS